MANPGGVAVSKRFLITTAAALLALSGLGTLVEAPVARAATVALPDMQMEVPTNAISIGTTSGTKQLRFTHITWDAGTGPFEIDPAYNATHLEPPPSARRFTTAPARACGQRTTACRCL